MRKLFIFLKWCLNVGVGLFVLFAFFSRFSSYLYQINIAFPDRIEMFPDDTPWTCDRTDSWCYFYGFPFVYAYNGFSYDPIIGFSDCSCIWFMLDIVFWVLVISVITCIIVKKRDKRQIGCEVERRFYNVASNRRNVDNGN